MKLMEPEFLKLANADDAFDPVNQAECFMAFPGISDFQL